MGILVNSDGNNRMIFVADIKIIERLVPIQKKKKVLIKTVLCLTFSFLTHKTYSRLYPADIAEKSQISIDLLLIDWPRAHPIPKALIVAIRHGAVIQPVLRTVSE